MGVVFVIQEAREGMFELRADVNPGITNSKP
jgi:hypothetical protein